MGKTKETPRYNVISMRISDEEKETLMEIIHTTHKSVSDVMRDAMYLFKSRLMTEQKGQRAA